MKIHAIFIAILVARAVLAVAIHTNDKELAALRGVQKKASDIVKQGPPIRRSRRRLNIHTNRRWKNRVGDVVQVPYVIDPRYFNSNAIAMIERNLQHLTDRCKVVQFVPRTSQSAYIHVVDKQQACRSNLGKIYTGREQELNLSYGCLINGTIQHEFLHALGLHHEQVRPDRDNYLLINFDNIIEKNIHNFELAEDSVVLGTEFDFGSVMLYGSYAFAVDDTVPTITALDPSFTEDDFGQRIGASDQDLLKLRLLYQCLSGPRTLAEYEANLCTADCKCWEGALGCVGNNEACQGTLVCSDNQCVANGGTTGTGEGGTDEECDDSTGWVDAAGDGCNWYEEYDREFNVCAIYGAGNSVAGETPNDACCVCGGGSSPTGSTNGGATSVGGCTDTVGWMDSDGDGCDYYEATDFCSQADGFANIGTGRSANEACCFCGGGSLGGVTLWTFQNAVTQDDCWELLSFSTTNGAFIVQNQCNGSPSQNWWIDSNNYIRSAVDATKCIVGSGGATSQGTNLIINDCLPDDSRFVFYFFNDGSIRPYNNFFQCIGPSESEVVEDLLLPVVELDDCDGFFTQSWSIVPVAQARRRLAERGQNDHSRLLQECSDVPLGWYDEDGFNCDWYAVGTRCDEYGMTARNFGKTATQACCQCGGGSLVDARAQDDVFLSDPVPPPADACYDTVPDWRDSVGDGCMWYAQGNNCYYYGDEFATSYGNANAVCCVCGGGTTELSPSVDAYGLPGCSDNPNTWVDADNDGCDFYAKSNNCELYGGDFAGDDGKTANEACCACGGGYDPNGIKTQAPKPSTTEVPDTEAPKPTATVAPSFPNSDIATEAPSPTAPSALLVGEMEVETLQVGNGTVPSEEKETDYDIVTDDPSPTATTMAPSVPLVEEMEVETPQVGIGAVPSEEKETDSDIVTDAPSPTATTMAPSTLVIEDIEVERSQVGNGTLGPTTESPTPKPTTKETEFGAPNKATGPSQALLITYSSSSTPPMWAIVVMMLLFFLVGLLSGWNMHYCWKQWSEKRSKL